MRKDAAAGSGEAAHPKPGYSAPYSTPRDGARLAQRRRRAEHETIGVALLQQAVFVRGPRPQVPGVGAADPGLGAIDTHFERPVEAPHLVGVERSRQCLARGVVHRHAQRTAADESHAAALRTAQIEVAHVAAVAVLLRHDVFESEVRRGQLVDPEERPSLRSA